MRRARLPGGFAGFGTSLSPLAFVLVFQGGFAVAVMALERRSGTPPELLYVAIVELFVAAFAVGVAFARLARRRREIVDAIAAPLDSAAPPARGASDAMWRGLVEACRAEAARRGALAESAARNELDCFLESVHELKNPATALSLMAERAEAVGEMPPLSDLRLEIDELGRAIDRALARLRLVDFEKGSRFSRFDAGALARSALRRHRRLFIASGIAAEVAGSFELESDPDWVAFILDQLLSNAAKHASSRVLVELATSADESPSRRRGMIDVIDDGPGFDPDEALRAFGRSASGPLRGLAAGCAAPASSGYGLYLARETALRLGASLAIASGEGGRLRLTFALPDDPLGDLTKA
jgi:signal transduction histidine kinase